MRTTTLRSSISSFGPFCSNGSEPRSKDFFKCREFAGSVTAECVTAGFIFLRRCLSDLEPREKTKAPPSTAVFR